MRGVSKILLRILSVVTFLFMFLFSTNKIYASSCTYQAAFSQNHADVLVQTNGGDPANINLYVSGVTITNWQAPGGSWDSTGFNTLYTDYNGGWSYFNWSLVGNGVVGWDGNTAIVFFYYPNSPPTYSIPRGIYRIDLSGNISNFSKVTAYPPGETQNVICSYDGVLYEAPINRPELTVIKRVINDDGGRAKAEDFTINVTGTNVSTPTFTASESGTIVNLDAGSYSVTEEVSEGYTTTTEGDCSETITDGDTKVCTIINDDIVPTITLTKNVINDNGGTLEPNDFGISVGGNLVTSGIETKIKANEPITINENSVDGYSFISIEGDGCPSGLGESVTLLPGQNISCVITNDDIAPPSVTKVVVIPGLGASWNVDALINCKNTGYSGGWTLAPYAKDIYNPLLSILPTQGWTPIPFYYDWRKDIRDNSSILNDLINSSVLGDEKINLVGHSMGGLIGRNYIESQNGGKTLKFLAVGTPNQGSTLVYPAIVNHEVWTNDLVQKIATTLLLNHCGTPNSLKTCFPLMII